MDKRQLAYIQSAIRTAYKKMPQAKDGSKKAIDECWTNARVGYGKYKCNICQGIFGPKEVHRDHVEPVIDPTTGFVDWNTFHERVNPPLEGWQILCHDCHHTKSAEENRLRRKYAKSIK